MVLKGARPFLSIQTTHRHPKGQAKKNNIKNGPPLNNFQINTIINRSTPISLCREKLFRLDALINFTAFSNCTACMSCLLPGPTEYPTGGPLPTRYPTSGPLPTGYPTGGPLPTGYPTSGPEPSGFPTAGPPGPDPQR